MYSLLREHSCVFKHADPHAVSEYVNQYIGTHGIRLPEVGYPQANLSHRQFANLDLCRISYGGEVRVISPALETNYHLQLLLKGRCLWRGDKQDHYFSPGELLLINPDDPVDLTYSDDCEKFILKLPTTLLESICDEQCWHRPNQGIRFLERRYPLEALEGFGELLEMICQEAESNVPVRRVQEHYADILSCKLLTLTKTNITRNDHCSQAAKFERIATFIGDNLKLEISCEQLAQHANMSLRSVYTLFERHTGTTPKHYIRQKKLEQVRRCLADPSCHVRSITELAQGYGFLHLGRFSEFYRHQFGELPSDALRRRD
jgi:AraC-like DNA-binding protein